MGSKAERTDLLLMCQLVLSMAVIGDAIRYW